MPAYDLQVIYHVAKHDDWHDAIASGEYRMSTLGRTLDEVGYIHASERDQVAGVVSAFYRGQTDLVLLVIDEAAVIGGGVEVRREEVGGVLFPHIYGALKASWVVALEDL